MDPDVKAALTELAAAHARLTERVDGLTATVSILASAQARTEEKLEKLTERTDGLAATMNVLASAQARTAERMAELAAAQTRTEERLGRLSEAMTRGFTDAAERHGEVMQRFDRLERR